MKALLAIFITISLLIGVYVISALIYFNLIWVLIGVTSVWAGLDSKRIGLSRYKSGISCSPVALFCICYLLWVVAFPCYLWMRFKINEGTAVLKDEALTDFSVHPNKFRQFSKCAGKIVEWLLFGLVALKMAFLAFCIEECWRGQHVLEKYRRASEAKGDSLDWNAMIPSPVPNSQNFYSAPMMSAWFVQPSLNVKITDDIAKRLKYPNASAQTVIAEITFVQSEPHPNAKKAKGALKFEAPGSSEQAKKLIQNAIGPYAFGSQGLTLIVQPLNISQIKPPRILLEAKQKPNAKDLISFFSSGPLIFRPDGSNSWRVLASFCPAADYLKWSDQFEGDFDLIREAVKRPYARIEGDYSFPPSMPIPNFISFRAVSQTLAQRAQCFLLLNQPDKALQELSLLNALRSKLEGAPTSRPMPLVSAMINVAILGLYVNILDDGFRLQAWKETQLATLEEQLEQINLAPFLKESFDDEEASSVRIIEVVIHDSEVPHVTNASLLQKIKNLRPLNITRGFLYFNAVEVVNLDQMLADSIDASNKTVSVSKTDEFQRQYDKLDPAHFWQQPYKLFAIIAVPNFKAIQTFAYDQTQANEAQIVCALERYRAINGSYPSSLNDLLPQCIGKLPQDIIDGQPLKYSKTSNGYLLYSIGWNQIDDGGRFSSSMDQGDWVWR